MTDVLVDLVVPAVGGGTNPAKGTVYVAAAARRRDGSHVVLATEVGQVLVNGLTTFTLLPGVYRFREDIPAGGGVTRVAIVPDSSTAVNYGDLQ